MKSDPIDPSELVYRPATEIVQFLRRGQVSSLALLEAFVARIEQYDGAINAVVVRAFDDARARARAADEALARGECWGPLHGLPMTVKESFDLPGTPTTFGIPDYAGNIAQRPAAAVQRLLDAGAVIFGKTNVPVALADWQSFNPVYGTTRNPWHLGRTPGGSSGGAAAALAAGFTALELGSDIGASIRNPAHYCGVYGHKPTWGVVPLEGHQLPGDFGADALDIAVAGPMARSAHDLSLAMELLTSPLRAFGPLGWSPAAWRDNGLPATQMRIAVIADDPCAPTDSSVRDAVRRLAVFLRGRGLVVGEDVRPVDSAEAWEIYVRLLRSATGAMMDDVGYRDAQQQAAACDPRRTDYPAWHWRSSTMSHREWVQWDKKRAKLRGQWASFFDQWDLLICPVATTPAFPHAQTGYRWERMVQVNGTDQPSTQSLFWAGYTNLCGLPSTAVPLERSPDGLPVGVQIAAPVFGDPACLRFARWLEDEYARFVAPTMPPRS